MNDKDNLAGAVLAKVDAMRAEGNPNPEVAITAQALEMALLALQLLSRKPDYLIGTDARPDVRAARMAAFRASEAVARATSAIASFQAREAALEIAANSF